MMMNSVEEKQIPNKATETRGQNFYHDYHYVYTHSCEEVPVDIHETE
jgi:hypothetical protein